MWHMGSIDDRLGETLYRKLMFEHGLFSSPPNFVVDLATFMAAFVVVGSIVYVGMRAALWLLAGIIASKTSLKSASRKTYTPQPQLQGPHSIRHYIFTFRESVIPSQLAARTPRGRA